MVKVLFNCLFLLIASTGWSNIPGGGTGTGPNVTLTDNGSTVTLANGIMSIVITKTSAEIDTINYTYNNSGTVVTNQLLSGNGGKLYWFQNPGTFVAGPFTESVVANNTNYAEISLSYASLTNGVMDIHYSMLRGSPGFYTTAILTHRSQDGYIHIELRPNIYAGSQFNWMSVDAARNRLMNVTGTAFAHAAPSAPQECFLWTNGIYTGQYEDKYKYSANLSGLSAWGWSSVGTGGSNVGLWNVSASAEYYPGGPMLRQLMEHIGTTILNVFTGNYYGLATDGYLQDGEAWSHVYGPYLYYCNSVTNALTGTNAAAQALYNDALAQGAAEETAWPYSWFTNASYSPAANRGTVSGKMVISDSGNPNASAANMWVGVVQQPAIDTSYDFQQWMKPCQFWVKTDINGNFTIPNVVAGTNYTLFAFGSGAAGTFMSQYPTGGSPPLLFNLPTLPFNLAVNGGAATNLGTITWIPTRVGATVFEIGYPDRTARKFRHGDDYWLGDIGPSPTQPSPIWTKYLEYQFDFPNGPNYVVGQSRWTTDWNFIQPVVPDSQGNFDISSSTITFNLASAPTNNAQASLYLGITSDYYSAIVVSVNGVNVGNISGLTGTPVNGITTNGYYAGYGDSDTSIREGNNGAFSDERITFPASQLQAGVNTINISFREIAADYFADHLMYDYVRLELAGYVPPPPASVTAYPGNNCNLVCWPVQPGATSYNIWGSTTSGGGYASISNGVTGPVSGCGSNNAVYLDATAANGTTYYYAVQSVNPTGSSTNSPPSSVAMPLASISATAPATPTGLTVSASGHQSVTLGWTPVSGANYYSVWRSTLLNNGGGASNVLSTIILNNTNAATSYTDTSPTDGSLYSYFVTATSAGGTSGSSAVVGARPLPAPPASAPISLTGYFEQTNNVLLNWSPVAGAVGYVIYRAASPSGPFTMLQSVTETEYVDYSLATNAVYYYRVVAVNDGGVSPNASDPVNGEQEAPASLSATGTNTAVWLAWSATSGATGYTLKRGPSPGNETNTVATGYAGTTYTNSGLVNGTTYYYVVTATGPGGVSGNSPEASATADPIGNGIWIANAGGNWSTGANWSSNQIAAGSGYTADFSTLNLASNLTVTLDSARTISVLKFGTVASGFNWTLAGTNTLTLGTSPNINVVNQSATISTAIAGSSGLAKAGLGALTLGGAAETFTNGLAVNVGILALDFTATDSPATNIIPAANALTLGGGTLQINGSSNFVSMQTFAGTVFTAGNSTLAAAPVSGTNNPALALASIGAVPQGVTVRINGPATINSSGNVVATAAISTTTAGGGTAGVLGNDNGAGAVGHYATVGLYDWASTDLANGTAGSSPFTILGGSQVAGFYQTTFGGNFDLTANYTTGIGQQSAATLRFNTPAATTFTIASASGTTAGLLTCGAILVTPKMGANNAFVATTSNTTFGVWQVVRTTSDGSQQGIIWQNNLSGYLNFTAAIVDGRQGTSTSTTITKAGAGTVVFAPISGSANSYSGQTYINEGALVISNNSNLGSQTSGAAVNLNGGTLVGSGTLTLDNAGANPRPVTLLDNGGGLAATAGNTLTVDGVVGSAVGAGPLVIGIPASSANGNVAGLLPGTGTGTANPTPVYATGTVVLTNANYHTGGTILQSGSLNINGIYALGGGNYGGLTFNGGTLQYVTNFPGNNGSSDLTSIGTAGVTLAAGGGTLDVNGNSVTYAGSIGNGGNGSLLVKSSVTNGILILQGANNYTGTTTVTNVTLLANNASGSATGTGNVTVQSGGILAGTGTMGGSVTVAAGATFAPGNPLGTLTVGGNLTLAGGSKTLIRVQHSPLTNNAVNAGGMLTQGGTLTVTNSGGTAFIAGDSFKLFGAAAYAGTFSSLSLPSLGSGLFWSTSRLTVDGTLGVVSTNPPAVSNVSLAGGNLVLQGINGTPNWSYTVLASTNLTLPLAQWTATATNFFDASGHFAWTNNSTSGGPNQFYVIRVQ